ncbi:MAG: ribosome assembly RNA-binding protein YhbY [Pseudomonadales bacterium]
MDNKTRRKYRSIAHHLKPVVLLGEAGLSDGVIAETERALSDHELIKIRISSDRDERAAQQQTLEQRCNAEVVQSIGRTLVLFRKNPKPNPKLSNLSRVGA